MDIERKTTTEIEEPDWSLLMFWEDITAIVAKLFELIRSLFGY